MTPSIRTSPSVCGFRRPIALELNDRQETTRVSSAGSSLAPFISKTCFPSSATPHNAVHRHITHYAASRGSVEQRHVAPGMKRIAKCRGTCCQLRTTVDQGSALRGQYKATNFSWNSLLYGSGGLVVTHSK